MRAYRNYIKPFLNHPLNRNRKFEAIIRFLKWQYRLRMAAPNEIIAPFIGASRFFVKKGRTGLTGNLYSGLHEFEDMMFLLHFLRPEDVFFDVGANAGSYSILSSSYCGAKTYSFEPIPETFNLLRRNRELNGNGDNWVLINSAIGDDETELLFSADRDTMNSVVGQGYSGTTVKVPVITLSSYCKDQNLAPLFLKVDAEGYDSNVIDGADDILGSDQVQVVIIEGSDDRIWRSLFDKGFKRFAYDPFDRTLTSGASISCNTLYIKDKQFCEERLIGASRVKVLSFEI